MFQCTQNAFHHAFEIGVDVRIPESKNLEALRLQKTVAKLIRARALGHSVLTAIGFYDESGLERNEVDDVTPDRCLSPEMKAEAFQFAQLHPQFDFLRRESFAKRAGIFVCQGWSSRKIHTFTCDCLPCQRLLIPSPLVYGISRFESGDRHFFGLLSRIRDRKFRDSSKVAAVIQCRLDDIQGDDDAV